MAIVAVVAVGGIGLGSYLAFTPTAAESNTENLRPVPSFTFGAPDVEHTSALFVGDSYVAGAGASSPGQGWATLASTDLGWSATNIGRGSTGYINPGISAGCGDDCGTYAEAIAAAEDIQPDVVVISGGRNDGPGLATQGTAIQATIEAARTRWPEAQIVVVSPVWDDDAPPSWVNGAVEVARDAALTAGATFLDIGQPLTGQDQLVADDGVHPNDDGHRALADAFEGAWNASASG